MSDREQPGFEPVPTSAPEFPDPGEPGPPPPPQAPQGWTYWDVVLVAVFALGVQIPLGLGALLVLHWAQGGRFSLADATTRVSFVLPVQVVWWALVFWVIYKVVRARDARPFAQAVGWTRPRSPAGVYFGAGAALALLVAWFSKLLPEPHKKMPIEELFRDPMSAFLLAAFGVLIAPIIEELLFRGFMYPVVERAHGAAAAVLATAAVFSLVHGQQYGWAWQNLLLLGFVGVVFGTIRAVSRSLVPSTLAHAAYNLTLFIGLYAASDHFRNFHF